MKAADYAAFLHRKLGFHPALLVFRIVRHVLAALADNARAAGNAYSWNSRPFQDLEKANTETISLIPSDGKSTADKVRDECFDCCDPLVVQLDGCVGFKPRFFLLGIPEAEVGNRRRNHAIGETMGCEPASHRAFDLRQIHRLG